MYSLHKGDCGLALSFINRAEHGEELIPEIRMALFTHVAEKDFPGRNPQRQHSR